MVAGVLTAAECKRALALLWDWLEAAAPKPHRLQRDDPTTWHHWPPTVEGGILPYKGAGQSRAAWFVRSRPKVSRAFGSVWGTQAPLVTSFDAVAAWRPWQPTSTRSAAAAAGTEAPAAVAATTFSAAVGGAWFRLQESAAGAWERRRRLAWRTEAGWFHVDQNPLLKPVRRHRTSTHLPTPHGVRRVCCAFFYLSSLPV